MTVLPGAVAVTPLHVRNPGQSLGLAPVANIKLVPQYQNHLRAAEILTE